MIEGKELDNIVENGALIGSLSPSKESKGAWSEVYFYDGKLYSVWIADTIDCWTVGAEEFDEEKLQTHVDDYEKAVVKLSELRA